MVRNPFIHEYFSNMDIFIAVLMNGLVMKFVVTKPVDI